MSDSPATPLPAAPTAAVPETAPVDASLVPIQLSAGAPMAEFQQYIEKLEQMHGWTEVDLVNNCFLMGEEVGELFKAVRKLLKVYPQSGVAPPADPTADVADELVDVFNYLLAIANRLDIDVEAAFRAKNARNQLRTWG